MLNAKKLCVKREYVRCLIRNGVSPNTNATRSINYRVNRQTRRVANSINPSNLTHYRLWKTRQWVELHSTRNIRMDIATARALLELTQRIGIFLKLRGNRIGAWYYRTAHRLRERVCSSYWANQPYSKEWTCIRLPPFESTRVQH